VRGGWYPTTVACVFLVVARSYPEPELRLLLVTQSLWTNLPPLHYPQPGTQQQWPFGSEATSASIAIGPGEREWTQRS
jgi:hypothetical protein